MDPFHYHPQVVSHHQAPPPPQLKPHQGEKCSNNNGNGNNYLCRQSSTRWIPTSEQIRILRDLYYNCGMRSPNSEEIQRISAMLRKYGKIEGKNVFYWFQNHKARERQKKRITVDVNGVGMMKPVGNGGSGGDQMVSPGALTPTVGASSSTPSSSSASLYGVAPTENNAYTTVPMLMEKNLNIDFDMNGIGEVPQIPDINGGLELGIHTSTPWQTPLHNHTEQSSAATAVTRELETLQLFPVKSSPEAPQPSNMQFHLHHQEAPAASPNLPDHSSCCNPSCYYQKQENQCMMYSNSQYLQPGALELTLGSHFVSPPDYYYYPGPM